LTSDFTLHEEHHYNTHSTDPICPAYVIVGVSLTESSWNF